MQELYTFAIEICLHRDGGGSVSVTDKHGSGVLGTVNEYQAEQIRKIIGDGAEQLAAASDR